MTAVNIVRFRVRPGEETNFIEKHRAMKPDFKGFLRGSVVRTGDRTFCVLAEWKNFQSIVNARPQMIGFLDSFRDILEDLGGGLGISDPVSGEVVLALKTSPKPKAKKKPARRAGKKRAKASRRR